MRVWTAAEREVVVATAGQPPELASPFGGAPFALLVVATFDLPAERRAQIAGAAIAGGCRYASSWGVSCEEWHEDFDWAYLAAQPDHQPSDETLVMTTAHASELLGEAVWFHLFCTAFQEVRFRNYLIWVLADAEVEQEVCRLVPRLLAS